MTTICCAKFTPPKKVNKNYTILIPKVAFHCRFYNIAKQLNMPQQSHSARFHEISNIINSHNGQGMIHFSSSSPQTNHKTSQIHTSNPKRGKKTQVSSFLAPKKWTFESEETSMTDIYFPEKCRRAWSGEARAGDKPFQNRWEEHPRIQRRRRRKSTCHWRTSGFIYSSEGIGAKFATLGIARLLSSDSLGKGLLINTGGDEGGLEFGRQRIHIHEKVHDMRSKFFR